MANTKLTKRTGWSARGQRYRTHAPFGSWKTQTFIAGLCYHGLTAPWIVDAPMNGRIFEAWIETQLAPTLSPGDVVILDNVASTKVRERKTGQGSPRVVAVPAGLFPRPQPY
ncbi:transposase [Rhizobium sp. 9140]|uniref:transposase n=1 Tax=Rhizobium sp. 9140 TaxID=1761900 RepID=UPI000B81AEBE|nr:transposase [Rhizobium sp. 9140]